MLQSAGLMPMVGAACSQIFVNNILIFSLLQFILKNFVSNFASILQKLYFFNRYKFLMAHYISSIPSVH